MSACTPDAHAFCNYIVSRLCPDDTAAGAHHANTERRKSKALRTYEDAPEEVLSRKKKNAKVNKKWVEKPNLVRQASIYLRRKTGWPPLVIVLFVFVYLYNQESWEALLQILATNDEDVPGRIELAFSIVLQWKQHLQAKQGNRILDALYVKEGYPWDEFVSTAFYRFTSLSRETLCKASGPLPLELEKTLALHEWKVHFCSDARKFTVLQKDGRDVNFKRMNVHETMSETSLSFLRVLTTQPTALPADPSGCSNDGSSSIGSKDNSSESSLESPTSSREIERQTQQGLPNADNGSAPKTDLHGSFNSQPRKQANNLPKAPKRCFHASLDNQHQGNQANTHQASTSQPHRPRKRRRDGHDRKIVAPASAIQSMRGTPTNDDRAAIVTDEESNDGNKSKYSTKEKITRLTPMAKQMYKMIADTLCKDLVAGGAGGPIDGEMTRDSMVKLIAHLTVKHGLGPKSRFLDIGSGTGKPGNVAALCDVQSVHGVEIVKLRVQKAHCVQLALLRDPKLGKRYQNVSFVHGDIMDAKTFGSNTHIYAFSAGMPPKVMIHLSKVLNRSSPSVRKFICTHKPREIIDTYHFQVELCDSIQVSMAGSREAKTCYIYQRIQACHSVQRALHDPICDPPSPHPDLDSKIDDVQAKVDKFLNRPRRTRGQTASQQA